ncbi:hypothetical protein [Paraburkholderia sp. GAS348]|uniref:hypothetical protein n=1 Tax=Paraburkholderia sp. GAS348 TaxID=3035132 RepID=UPI003D2445C4
MPEDLVRDAYLCATHSFDGFHGDNTCGSMLAIGRNTRFTEWQRWCQMADGAPDDEALHCRSFETQVARRADALSVQYSCMPEVDHEIAAESP